jgi:8-oxo-dGTP diphosphatase
MSISNADIVAKVFIRDAAGKILTMQRSANDRKNPLRWDLPGGSVEHGEDPRAAVIRETMEEAGLEITDPHIFSVSSRVEKRYIIRLVFWADYSAGEVRLSHEHKQYKWVTLEEYVALDVPVPYREAAGQLPSR